MQHRINKLNSTGELEDRLVWSQQAPELFKTCSGYNPALAAPFGLDYDPTVSTNDFLSNPATGYREGGPKEARLFRVALLKSDREVDHLHPVKVKNIDPKIAQHHPEKLKEVFSQYGEVGDIYIPRNLKNGHAYDFGIVRFTKRDAVDKLLTSSNENISSLPLKLETLRPQSSFFSKNTGSLGICNEPVGDIDRYVEKKVVEQDIKLSECLSRSGYPWGSRRELKVLEPHASKEVIYLHSLEVKNLPKDLNETELIEIFSKYGEISCVYFPKPLHVNLRTIDANMGHGFIRFVDVRDLKECLKDIQNKQVIIKGNIITAFHSPPPIWPSEKTRRYY